MEDILGTKSPHKAVAFPCLNTTINSRCLQHTFMPPLEVVDPGGGLNVVATPKWRDASQSVLAGSNGGLQLRLDSVSASPSVAFVGRWILNL